MLHQEVNGLADGHGTADVGDPVCALHVLDKFFRSHLARVRDLHEMIDEFGVRDGDFFNPGDFLKNEICAQIGYRLATSAGENFRLLGFDFPFAHPGLHATFHHGICLALCFLSDKFFRKFEIHLCVEMGDDLIDFHVVDFALPLAGHVFTDDLLDLIHRFSGSKAVRHFVIEGGEHCGFEFMIVV